LHSQVGAIAAEGVVVNSLRCHCDDNVELDEDEEREGDVPEDAEYFQPPLSLLQQLAAHFYVKVHRQEKDEGAAPLFKGLQEDAGDLCREAVVKEHKELHDGENDENNHFFVLEGAPVAAESLEFEAQHRKEHREVYKRNQDQEQHRVALGAA